MLRATLDQMRSSAGRLAAAGIAIVLGTAFVAAALLASATIRQATHDAFTASYADADLVLTADGAPMSADLIQSVRDTDGVQALDVHAYFGMEMTGPSTTEFVSTGPTPSDPRLATSEVTEGRDATAPGEVVLATAVAERLGAELGDVVSGSRSVYDDTSESDPVTERLTVVGLLEQPSNMLASTDGALVAPEELETWRTDSGGSDDVYGSAVLALADGADVETVRSAIADLPALGDVAVQTVPEIAAQRTAEETGSDVTFLVILLGFASVALAVAGLVITNTFQVLVAQRTRTLALLRCVGASRGQIRRSVLLEAVVLGVLASLVGLGLGTGLVNVGVRVLADVYPGAAIGTEVPFGAAVPIVTLLVGLVVTVLSALVPARMATRVAPIAALRPVEGVIEPGASRRRRVVSIGALLTGAAMLAGGAALAVSTADTDMADYGVLGGLALGVVGGLVSLTGILVGAVFLVPRLLPLLGRLAGRSVPSRIATANAVRNPRRTAATTNALVIGVALVVMMSTGALSARQTLVGTLDSTFPVDVQAATTDPSQPVLPAQVDAVAGVDGVAETVTVRSTYDVEIASSAGSLFPMVAAFAEGDPALVLRDPDVLDQLDDDTVLVDPALAAQTTVADGDTVSASTPDGTSVDLTIRLVQLGDVSTAYVTSTTLDALTPEVPANGVWLRMADDVDEVAVATEVQAALNEVTSADPEAPVLQVSGAALERAAYGQVIDTLLSVVLGLLAVAVVIALVGVANTLSLSVLERRRENATLRAMGLRRGQLRGMLAVEGVLIAAVGAVLGAVSGLIYGWAGASIVLGGIGGAEGLELGVPWLQLGAVAVVAVLAGLVASVLPARSAVRQPPVAALAAD